MENIHPIFDSILSRSEKENFFNQQAKVIWLTGLSGSGKSTIARALEKELHRRQFATKLLDGDNIRTGLGKDLSFTEEDRRENIRRISEVAKLFLDGGIICICSFVSPTLSIRQMSKNIIGEDDFLEVYVHASLETCESRDVKGLYKKAREGKIKQFTGIDSPYEPPLHPFLTIHTDQEEASYSSHQLLHAILPIITYK